MTYVWWGKMDGNVVDRATCTPRGQDVNTSRGIIILLIIVRNDRSSIDNLAF